MSDSSEIDQPLFPETVLDELRSLGQVKTFPKKSLIVIEGEPAESLYIVLEGQLRVFVADEEGNEAELAQLGPGELFGELMLASSVRTASVRTLQTSKLCMVRRHEFETFLQARPDVAFNVIQSLIHRVKVLTANVHSLALMDVYGRVVRLFLESLTEDESGARSLPGISQQKIAERVGASRSMINRILKDLTDGGYISVSREKIELHKTLPKKW